jgi:group I intron endonuclease
MNFIYVTTNIINGKKYVGSHRGSPNDSYLGSGTIFKNSIKKYGAANFKREVLKECNIEENLFWEEKYIRDLNTLYPNGYNLSKNGGFNIFTDDLRKKLSDAKMGKPRSAKRREISEETRKKMRESAKKRIRGPRSEETKEKIRKANLGKKRKPETRQKLSASLSGKKLSPETKKKMSEFQKGRVKSDQERKHIAESKKGEKNPMFGKIPWNKKIII